ncbi:tumor necrosis factor receptor superfamily member 19L isoform X1 [Rana temporaria]|uniref:tumor necrosis factor receptor superfamily member 19L isoform X1 n=1 Tax=Rana temporaria TaxID=8407 RepID=UPI001AACD0E3|nr:tumor necrosis factor receptor superfamily member 19L isoform X1 [Rana temporaria]
MMRNTCQALASCLLLVQVWEALSQEEVCGKMDYQDDSGQCMPCTKCPPGKEPEGVCGFGIGTKVGCRPCASGMFSSRHGLAACSMHTQCDKKKRIALRVGTPNADAVCGDCIPRHFPLVPKSPNVCVACWLAPPETVGCEGERTLRPRAPRTLEAASNADKASQNGTHKGMPDDSRTQYAVLAIVPVFCMMGLTGIFLCNLLKKKGYRCTSHKPDEEAVPEKEGINPSILLEENGNEDTIGVLVRLITEKRENAVALEELLKDYHSKQIPTVGSKSPPRRMHLLPQMPNLCKHQHHLHTVQGPASRSGMCCTRCSQKKWPNVLTTSQSANNIKLSRNQLKTSRSGEVTILSVGRFRVARIPEQKTNPPDVKAISEVGEDEQDVPSSEPSEQRVLMSDTVKANNHSLEDTSKLEDVI